MHRGLAPTLKGNGVLLMAGSMASRCALPWVGSKEEMRSKAARPEDGANAVVSGAGSGVS